MPGLTEFYGNFQGNPRNPLMYNKEPIEDNVIVDNENKKCPFMKNDFLRNVSRNNRYCNFFEPGEKIKIFRNYPMFPKSLKQVHFASSRMQYKIPSFVVLHRIS